ncbi:hypothetical protein CQA72_29675, partial [Klebsiella pneumoniae]
ARRSTPPHRPALDALATHLTLRADHFGDALEDPSFPARRSTPPHRPALDALATHLTLRADHFGDALE